jgi:alkylation response protein AidB-like acyl-CoA dehydrogenase
MAKAYAGDAAFRVAASALQVHGGIGFTWEHDLHFYLKRGKANAHAFGDSRWHRDRVAELAGITAASAPAASPALSSLARSPAPAG